MSSLNYNNNFLQTLIGAGADAHKNLFEVNFYGKLSDLNNKLKVRCDSFTPPTTSQGSYPVKYITATIDRPSAKITLDRTISFDFRVDANYEVYKALLAQQAKTFNPTKSFAANDIYNLKDSGELFDVAINAVTGDFKETLEDSDVTNIFNFKYCWISSIDTIAYSTDGSNPSKVRVTLKFLEMQDEFEESIASTEN